MCVFVYIKVASLIQNPRICKSLQIAFSAVGAGGFCCPTAALTASTPAFLLDTHLIEFFWLARRISHICSRDIIIAMSRRNVPKVELKLNLSPPRSISQPRVESPRSSTASPTSPPSSCLSSDECLRYSTSPEATSMMLVGCPNCLMYVMLAAEDPRCPKCKTTVLLDVIHDYNTITNKNSAKIGSEQKK